MIAAFGLLFLLTLSKQYIRSMRFSTLSGEGWGMTFDGHHLVVSDGSASIAFWYLPEADAAQPVLVRNLS